MPLVRSGAAPLGMVRVLPVEAGLAGLVLAKAAADIVLLDGASRRGQSAR